MNQIVKRKVYHRGTMRQAKFLAELTEMTPEETKMFLMFHDRKDDQYVQDELGVNRSTFDWIEESMSSKLLIGVLRCIDYAEDHMELD